MIRTALVVPLRVDVLAVDQRDPDRPTVTAGPLADFSRLPFQDGGRDVNAGRPHLAEEITQAPFEEAGARLPTGVHLHWALPAALTHGRHRPAADAGEHESTVATVDFPRVPNRWLVDAPDGRWIVESDYLHPVGSTGSAVPYLLPPAERGRAPFRRLGRQVPLAEWRPHDPTAEHLAGLTAVGWGHPAFHAYHPNCHSVFGFHHATADPDGAARFSFRVFGWYSRLAHDPVAAFAAARPDAGPDDVAAEFGWTTDGSARPERLLCAGVARVPASDPAPPTVDRIVLGATGTEALAAHAAQELHDPLLVDSLPGDLQPRARGMYEELLESVVLAGALDPDRPDALATLAQTRHQQEFVAVTGDVGWTVRARGLGDADAARAPHGVPGTVPEAAVSRLAELGRISVRRDRLDRHRDALRTQLHADWCAYLQCKYPPPGSRLDRPDVDGVRRYIQATSLAGLESIAARADRATTELAAVAAEIHTVLAEADAADCEVTGADVVDWAEFAEPAAALGLIPERLAQQVRDRPADDGLQAAVLAALRAIVRAPGPPPGVPEDRLDAVVPGIPDWLGTGAPDRADEGLDRTVAALFPEPTAAAAAWRTAAAARIESVRTALRNRVVLEALLRGQLSATRRVRHELATRPGPRFWRPRDPVLLLTGSAVAPTERHSGTGTAVTCALAPLGADPSASVVAALDGDGSVLAVAIEAVLERGTDTGWHPIMADWKVALHEEAGEDGRYHSGYLTGRYQLAAESPELTPWDLATDSTGRVAVLSGRALLSPHPAGALGHALRNRPRPADGTQDFPDRLLGRAEDLIESENVQAVSLAGLHAGLLMHEPVLPLDLADPLGFPEARAFAARVAAAVGHHTGEGPRPMLPFMPLRAGRLQVLGLRLLDSFGRVLDVPVETTPVSAAEAMPASTAGRATVFALPPRLIPPTRLHVRWLAAGTATPEARHEARPEAHDHPSTSAVCGWIVPNLLDRTLDVHAAGGAPLGSVDLAGRWWPAPGADRILPPEAIEDPHLRRLVVHLLHLSATEREDVVAAIDDGVDRIEPDDHGSHRALALLAGRPLAVVRASLRLEVLGSPPVERSWAGLRAAINGSSRSEAGLREVQFPVRLGEPGRLDDGLIAYWVENGSSLADMRVAGASAEVQLDAPAQTLTLLVDPRATLHATSGILPTKALRLPPEQYVAALKGIGVAFLTSPLLTDPGTLRVAVPAEPGFEWSWLERTPAGWVETPASAFGAVRTEASLAAQQELREGWLQLRPEAGA